MCIKSGPEAILGSQNDAIQTKAKAEVIQQLAPFEIKPECKKFTGNYIIRLTYIIVFLLYILLNILIFPMKHFSQVHVLMLLKKKYFMLSLNMVMVLHIPKFLAKPTN